MKPAKEFSPVDVALIDCFFVAYRGYCVTPPLHSPNGTPTSAIHGFLGAVRNMIKDLKPKTVIVATEGRYSFREQIHKAYKEGRSLPEPFAVQIPLIHEMCRLFGWHLIEREGYEADDVVASVCRHMKASNLRGAIFTTDKDLISLSDPNITIFSRQKGKSYILETADYEAKWGVPPSLIPQVLMLTGDSVDNIPGLKGVGQKTAVKWIQEFGSIDNLYQNLDKLPEKHRKLLSENRDQVELSRSLINLRDDLALPPEIFQMGAQQTEALIEFFTNLGMIKTAESLVPQASAQMELEAASPALLPA